MILNAGIQIDVRSNRNKKTSDGGCPVRCFYKFALNCDIQVSNSLFNNYNI